MFSIVYRKLVEIQFRKRKPFGRFHCSKMFDEFKCNGHDYLKEVGSLEGFCYVTIQITWSSKAKALWFSFDPPSLAVYWQPIFYRDLVSRDVPLCLETLNAKGVSKISFKVGEGGGSNIYPRIHSLPCIFGTHWYRLERGYASAGSFFRMKSYSVILSCCVIAEF